MYKIMAEFGKLKMLMKGKSHLRVYSDFTAIHLPSLFVYNTPVQT